MQPTATLPSAADALTALNSYQQPDSASVLGQAQQKYGIQGLQDRVNTYKTLTNNLTGAIAAVDPSVTGRTAGSLVTEGQRGALVNRERAPITQELGVANQGLSGATNDLNTASQNAKDEANAKITDNQNKYNQLLQTYNIANTREQQQQQAAQEAAKQAEATREFNVSASQKAPTAASTAANKQADFAGANQFLSSRKGADNHVSQATWNAALQKWLDAGYNGRDFVTQFQSYINPKYGGYQGVTNKGGSFKIN